MIRVEGEPPLKNDIQVAEVAQEEFERSTVDVHVESPNQVGSTMVVTQYVNDYPVKPYVTTTANSRLVLPTLPKKNTRVVAQSFDQYGRPVNKGWSLVADKYAHLDFGPWDASLTGRVVSGYSTESLNVSVERAYAFWGLLNEHQEIADNSSYSFNDIEAPSIGLVEFGAP